MKDKSYLDWELIDSVCKEVEQWPQWKKDAAASWLSDLDKQHKDDSKSHCGCGYCDCNHRGY